MPPLDKRQIHGNRGAANNAPYSGSIVPGDLLDEIKGQIDEDAKLNAQPIKIADIYPDLTQPRKVLPSAVRRLWNGKTDVETMRRLFEEWWQLVMHEREDAGRPEFDMLGYLEGRDVVEVIGKDEFGDDVYPDAGPLETSLLHVVILAYMIKLSGLINAITVAVINDAMPVRYMIETGERRWFAYQLLRATYPQVDEWVKIPARIVEEIDEYRQSSENTARQNLSAIEKARQYAKLLMRAHKDAKTGEAFKTLTDVDHEHHYYRQAADYRIPDGFRDKIMKAMGVTSASEIALCRKLLIISDKVWDLADDYKVPQAKILECAEMPEPMALKYLDQMIDHRSSKTVPRETAEAVSSTPSDTTPKSAFASVWKAFVKGKQVDRSKYEAVKAWMAEVEKANGWDKTEGEP